ncbi:hypothetical protein TRVL_07767 [Trypanosoma vivax]|nr:hypothetical protein TRVL_07767 [Trypanosoma vivax]
MLKKKSHISLHCKTICLNPFHLFRFCKSYLIQTNNMVFTQHSSLTSVLAALRHSTTLSAIKFLCTVFHRMSCQGQFTECAVLLVTHCRETRWKVISQCLSKMLLAWYFLAFWCL